MSRIGGQVSLDPRAAYSLWTWRSLIVDGREVDLGKTQYLLSPQDGREVDLPHRTVETMP